MKLGIIGAMQVEVETLVANLEDMQPVIWKANSVQGWKGALCVLNATPMARQSRRTK